MPGSLVESHLADTSVWSEVRAQPAPPTGSTPKSEPASEIEDRVAARLGRQSRFGRERPARFTFFIHEFVLRLPVGGPAVMAEQLAHLLRKVTRPYLTLRVVPAALCGHAAINGAFRLMEFAEFLEKPEEIAAYRRILGLLAQTALSEGQSTELIATLATELYADREDHDHRA